MNPHIKTIEKEAYKRYSARYRFNSDSILHWAANRQRELDEQEIAELRAENDRLVKREEALKQIITERTRTFARANELDATGELRNVYANQVEEIQELRTQVERLKEKQFPVLMNKLATAKNEIYELSKQQPDPALAEVLAKFTPPFRYDEFWNWFCDADDKPVTESIGNAIAEFLNNQVKKESI